ncbi:hypothetical protein GFH48_26000 [Streptomyces fagopyri]|uniref:Lipoprotein n=1 Tax=Streptomyces fagopyri TaxID=2662397 RepID=A0A5Q0LGV2_9ACTN|nr:hypothetical protein [Streptomyces fagopyri]QFZ76260.1 hypothetical protein GFH48_26000 [Streptomyces fagopyri]
MGYTRGVVWAGVAAVALAGTAGCGAETAKRTAEAVGHADAIMAALGRATDRTDALGSAEVKMTTAMKGGAPIAMEGTYSWGDGFAYDVEMDTKAAKMETLTHSPTIHTLLVDGAYYYDTEPQSSGPLKGKEWMKVDGSAVFGEKGAQALTGSSGAGSPAASMRGLKYASDVKSLGKETVDGKSATHYWAVIDKNHMGKAKDALASEDDTLFNSATGGADTITMDVWVGAKDLPVRLKEVIGAMTVTMDFEKFGATAHVKAPPAAQVGDVTDLMKKAVAQQQ